MSDELIEQAAYRCFNFVEQRCFFGDTASDPSLRGLCNQPWRNDLLDYRPGVVATEIGLNFVEGDSEEVADAIESFVCEFMKDASNLRDIERGSPLFIGMPPSRLHRLVSDSMMSYNKRIVISEYLEHRSLRIIQSGVESLRLVGIYGLEPSAHQPPIMVAWLNHMNIFEFAMSIAPYPEEPETMPSGLRVPVRVKCAPAPYIKDPRGIRYGVGI